VNARLAKLQIAGQLVHSSRYSATASAPALPKPTCRAVGAMSVLSESPAEFTLKTSFSTTGPLCDRVASCIGNSARSQNARSVERNSAQI